MKKNSKIFFVAALPPPLGGQSKINKVVFDTLAKVADIVLLNISANSLNRGVAYHCTRLLRVFKCLFVFLFRVSATDKLYISVDSGFGLVYNIIFLVVARVFGLSVFLHYHSFTFVDSKNKLADILVNVSGAKSTHVFLCEKMAYKFSLLYDVKGERRICSNASIIFDGENEINIDYVDDTFCLGLVSHLSDEKGLNDFIKLLAAAKEKNINVVGVLAGPPVSGVDEKFISDSVAFLDGTLIYLGPIYGQDKDDFFRKINCFVFPTRFKVEAQPLVLFEALSYGIPIISYDRGCIKDDLDVMYSHVIPRDVDFVPLALRYIQFWMDDDSAYKKARVAAYDAYRCHVKKSELDFVELINLLTK